MEQFKVLCKVNKSEIIQDTGSRVNITGPRILDIIIDENGEWVTPKHLKYFQLPSPSTSPINLNLNYENCIHRIQESKNKVEKYFVEHDKKAFLNKSGKQQIFTTRNILKEIMLTPYNNQDFCIDAIKFGDVIYLSRKRSEDIYLKGHSYHFKLHQYCFSDVPNGKLETDEPVNVNRQLFCILRTYVNNFEILYTAEVIGVESDHEIENFKNEEELNKCKFVITKLLKEPNWSQLSDWRNDKTLLTAWIQSYLACADKVYFAFKTKTGFVKQDLECIETENLPKDQIWNPEVCKRYLHYFLDKVERVMTGIDCPHTVYKFCFDSKMQILKYRAFQGKTELSFISEEFIKYMQKN